LQRSLGEREHKMAQLAAKIKANNEARKAPQRTTKLAFEHSLVKPPRNVRKQQVRVAMLQLSKLLIVIYYRRSTALLEARYQFVRIDLMLILVRLGLPVCHHETEKVPWLAPLVY